MKCQRGITLTSMMIGLALGLFLTVGLLQILLTTKQSVRESAMFSELDVVGRDVLTSIVEEIRIVGYFGGIAPSDVVYGNAFAGTAICTGNNSEEWERAEFPYCLDSYLHSKTGGYSFMGSVKPGTHSIVFKRAAGSPVSDFDLLENDTPYIVANYLTGILALKDEANITPSWSAMGGRVSYGTALPMVAAAYAVENNADGVPSLFRYQWNHKETIWNRYQVVEGVDDFYILFGVDTDGDGSANSFHESAQIATTNTNNLTWDNVISAQVFILARSSENDPSVINQAVYKYGTRTLEFGDKIRRRLFQNTVTLENARYAVQFDEYKG